MHLARRAAALRWPAAAAVGQRRRLAAGSSSSSSSGGGGGGGLPVVHHPLFSAPQLPPGHRFPMGVFGAIHDRLLATGAISEEQVHVPQRLPTDAALSIVHCERYVRAFTSGTLDDAAVRRIGFGAATRTPLLVARTKAEVAGTLLAARLALSRGLALSTAGGTHHAFADAGSGFCILNDLAFTAATLLAEGAASRVLILDLDVHQGDGTAAICADLRPHVFTLSVHAANNFPARKQASDLDVALPDGTADDAYLAAVAEVLPGVLSSFAPDLVLYDAGVDVHVDDKLGRLAVSDAGLMRRELLVLDTCLAAGVPVAGFVGGGYAADLSVLVDRHTALHRAALRMWGEHGL
ncbi:hypothetical protein HT031_006733 [Scenedesmus sp. PABB004]|nr:hypothetical protein HT031_006733 [Scenedesmus sp. PABB004]